MLSNGSVGNGGSRMDGTLSQSMDSVNTVAAEEEVRHFLLSIFFLLTLTIASLRRASAILAAGPATLFSPSWTDEFLLDRLLHRIE